MDTAKKARAMANPAMENLEILSDEDFVKALPNPEKFKDVAEQLDIKAKKLRQRKDEAKAHQRNVRFGKKK